MGPTWPSPRASAARAPGGRAPTYRLLPTTLALAAACGPAPPPSQPQPAPSSSVPAASAAPLTASPYRPRPAAPPACELASTLRARAFSLVAAGWLDRALRSLERADALCEATAPRSRALRAKALAAVGESAAARALVAELDAARDLSPADAALRDEARAALAAEPPRRLVLPAELAREKARLGKAYAAIVPLLDADRPAEARARLLAWLAEAEPLGLPTGKARFAAAWAAYVAAGSRVSPALRAELDRTLRTMERDESAKAGTAVRARLDTTDGFEGSVTSLALPRDEGVLAVAHGTRVSLYHGGRLRELERLEGHDQRVTSVDFRGDGQVLASGSADDTVRLWSRDGAPLGVLRGHTKPVTAVAWSPDGATLASASEDKTVRLWSRAGGAWSAAKELKGHTSEVAALAWSPDGAVLASASSDGTARLWSRAGASTATLRGHDHWVSALAWSPDGGTLATGSWDHTVRLWSRAGALRATLEGHDKWVGALAWSPDGRSLASGAGDTTVRVWSATGELVKALEGSTSWVNTLAWRRGGRLLAGAGDGTVREWSAQGTLERSLGRHTSQVASVAWSPDGSALATGLGDGSVRWWEDGRGGGGEKGAGASDANEPRRAMRTLVGHAGEVSAVAWSAASGARLASAGADGAVRLRTRAGELVATLDGLRAPVTSLAWSPDGSSLAFGAADSQVRVWPGAGEVRALEGHGYPVLSVAWSSTGVLASGSSDNTARLWHVAAGKARPLEVLTAHEGDVGALAWSPDGRVLASGATDQTLRLWGMAGTRVEPLRALQTPDKVTSAAWSPDGALLAYSLANGEVRLVAPDGALVASHAGALPARAVAFHPQWEGLLTAVVGRDVVVLERSGGALVPALWLRARHGADAGYAYTPSEHAVELVGGARDVLTCRVGSSVYDFELCAGRFERPGMVAAAWRGEAWE
jgi:WD40 repeat protein